MALICTTCYSEFVPPARSQLGYKTCLSCGERQASKVTHCAVPLSKSNYVLVTDRSELKGLNPKLPQS
jgi:hypothetical protein